MLPAFVPLPMVNAQRSWITIGDPFVPFNVPRAVSLVRLKTLISPLPLLPTSKSPARGPNDDRRDGQSPRLVERSPSADPCEEVP